MGNIPFDIDAWSTYFSDPKNQTEFFRYCESTPRSSYITEPGSAVVSFRIREKTWPDLDPSTGIPTDIFILGLGEPDDPSVTKIGGMPFLPTSMPWPMLPDGRPKEFVAQFNLADSRDLLPDLPGDILLLFCEACADYALATRDRRMRGEAVEDPPKPDGPVKYYLMDESWEFIFVDSSTQSAGSLWSRDAAPDAPFFLRPLHGQRIRSCDLPKLEEAYNRDLEMLNDDSQYTKSVPGILNATKLGGVPSWEQGEPFSDWASSIGQPDGPVFIGQLNSDQAQTQSPHPYVGRTEPYESPYEERRYRQLTIADVGALYLFWDGENMLYEVQGG